MKCIYYLLTIAVFAITLFSCKQETKNQQPSETVNQSTEFELIDGEKFQIADLNVTDEAQEISTDQDAAPAFGKKPEPFVNEKLPITYTKRKVIKGGAVLSYDIFYLPGNIVRYDEKDSNYILVTPKSILKNSALPKIEAVQDGILYSNKIDKNASFNASALIGGLSVNAEQLLELIIQDVSKSTANDTLIDTVAIKNIANKIPEATRKNYFFVKSSLLTFVTFRKYTKADLTAKVNTSYVTAEGKAYSSNDKFSKERVVSLDLISFDDLLIVLAPEFKQANK